MNTKLLATTTAIALLTALPVLASAQSGSPTAGQRLDSGITATENALSDAAENVRDMFADKDSSGAYPDITYNMKTSAAGIIGQSVYNTKNEEVAKVQDILINPNGIASQVILTNGGFLGMGAKLVALDYGLVYVRNNNNDVIMAITEEVIKNMVPFSYTAADAKDGMRTVPPGYLSAKAMLAGHLLDSQGKQVASVDNISLNRGDATYVIVSQHTTLGMGGDKYALAYDRLQMTRADRKAETTIDFKLSETQSARFESHTKTSN